jgi:hypothetical protein
MGLAILGAVTVVASSNASNPRVRLPRFSPLISLTKVKLDPSGLVQAIKQPVFIVYTALNAVAIPLLILLSRSQRWGGRFIGVDVGICALFGGYTVLSTKALSSLLSTIFLGAFQQWISWILVAVLVGTSVMQIKYLNKALMRFQSKVRVSTTCNGFLSKSLVLRRR